MNRVDAIFWVTERMGISTKSQISNDLYKMVVLPKGASKFDTKIGSPAVNTYISMEMMEMWTQKLWQPVAT